MAATISSKMYMRYAPCYSVHLDGRVLGLFVYRQDAERKAKEFPGATVEASTQSLDKRISSLKAELAELEAMRRGERIDVR